MHASGDGPGIQRANKRDRPDRPHSWLGRANIRRRVRRAGHVGQRTCGPRTSPNALMSLLFRFDRADQAADNYKVGRLGRSQCGAATPGDTIRRTNYVSRPL